MLLTNEQNTRLLVQPSPNRIVAGGIQGPPGIPGVNGQNGADAGAWLSGATVPSNSLGNDGQTYINTATGEVYKKTAGVWAVDFTLTANSVEYANVLNKPPLSVTFPFNNSLNITCNHNMGKKPSVRVIDSGGTEWYGAVITYNDLNNITVTFTFLFGGELILS